jgi:Domain of unknown function (DUF4158)
MTDNEHTATSHCCHAFSTKRDMPVSFLTPVQRERYGRYPASLSADELARYFYLGDDDREWISQKHREATRLGIWYELFDRIPLLDRRGLFRQALSQVEQCLNGRRCSDATAPGPTLQRTHPVPPWPCAGSPASPLCLWGCGSSGSGRTPCR